MLRIELSITLISCKQGDLRGGFQIAIRALPEMNVNPPFNFNHNATSTQAQCTTGT